MTPENQRVAIAEACGWTECWINQNGEPWGFLGELHYSQSLPDYLNDLNAMHEVEDILNADQMVSYDYHLDRVVGNGRQGLNIEYFLWSATAAQRAEAFLRTIGKWEEAK